MINAPSTFGTMKKNLSRHLEELSKFRNYLKEQADTQGYLYQGKSDLKAPVQTINDMYFTMTRIRLEMMTELFRHPKGGAFTKEYIVRLATSGTEMKVDPVPVDQALVHSFEIRDVLWRARQFHLVFFGYYDQAYDPKLRNEPNAVVGIPDWALNFTFQEYYSDLMLLGKPNPDVSINLQEIQNSGMSVQEIMQMFNLCQWNSPDKIKPESRHSEWGILLLLPLDICGVMVGDVTCISDITLDSSLEELHRLCVAYNPEIEKLSINEMDEPCDAYIQSRIEVRNLWDYVESKKPEPICNSGYVTRYRELVDKDIRGGIIASGIKIKDLERIKRSVTLKGSLEEKLA